MEKADRRHILVDQHFRGNQLRISIRDGVKTFSDKDRQHIEEAWEMRPVDKNLFNGEILSLVDFKTENDQLWLQLQRTTFKDFWGTNVLNRGLYQDREGEMANSLAACCVLETSDHQIPIGLRSSLTDGHSSFWHLCGGCVDIPDPFELMRRELNEEFGCDRVENLVCLGLGRNPRTWRPELFFSAQTPYTSPELLQQTRTASHRHEHIGFAFIPCVDIVPFSDSHPFSPIGRLALATWKSSGATTHEE